MMTSAAAQHVNLYLRWVCCDDFKVTHTKTNVVQYNEYYPFGLQTSKSWTRDDSSNRFLYNAGSELNDNTAWYETFYRGYDPSLGRFLQVDPLAHMSSSHSPYNYAFNDPVLFNDPNGDYPSWVPQTWSDASQVSGGNTYGGNPMGAGNHWSDGYRSADGNAAIMSTQGFNSYYGTTTDEAKAIFSQQVGYSLPSASFGAIAGAFNNGGSITLDNDYINLFYCDCSAQVLTNGYGGDPVELADGGNVVRGYNTIIDAEFEFTRTGVGRSGTWESLIPVWGSGRDAIDDFHYGDWGRGLGNAALAVSDVFLIKSIATGLAKGGLKLLGSSSWNATRKYYLKTGFAESGKPLHHWLIHRNGTIGKFVPDGIKNQMWNLIPYASDALHMRAGHGMNYLGQPGYGFAGRLWFGTPTWLKAATVSGGGRAIN